MHFSRVSWFLYFSMWEVINMITLRRLFLKWYTMQHVWRYVLSMIDWLISCVLLTDVCSVLLISFTKFLICLTVADSEFLLPISSTYSRQLAAYCADFDTNWEFVVYLFKIRKNSRIILFFQKSSLKFVAAFSVKHKDLSILWLNLE